MATTVAQAFGQFLDDLLPKKTETDAAESHSASVKGCLDKALTLKNFFSSGSFGNGTNIRAFSDLDYLASVAAEDVSDTPAAFLTKIKNILAKGFPETEVLVRTPAVSVRFAKGKETVEVVPGQYSGTTVNTEKIYYIARPGGGWAKTSPTAHNAYVTAANQRLSYKVKPLVRLLKVWKYHHAVSISSFYLELRTARYSQDRSEIVYPDDVRGVCPVCS